MADDYSTWRSFVTVAMRAPYLSREEEIELAECWRNRRDERALHRLTAAHMRLVIAIAMRFRHYGLPLSDLAQEGHIGLLEAAARFEPDREVRFATYATWWVRAAIQDYVLRNWSIVRGGTSSAQKALFFNLRRVRARLAGRNGSDGVSDRDVAIALKVAEADVNQMSARLSGPDISLNAPFSGQDGESRSERGDTLVDESEQLEERVADRIDGERLSRWLAIALERLSPRERDVLTRRRLVEEGATLEALGAAMGISKERVRQIESRAIDKLRCALLAQPGGQHALA